MRQSAKSPKIRSVKFNVLMNMLLTSSQMLFPLITLPYVSRVLSTYGTGAVAFAQSVLTYFSLVALMGMQTYGVKACAAVRDKPDELSQTVKELLVILLISTSVVFVIYILLQYFSYRDFGRTNFYFCYLELDYGLPHLVQNGFIRLLNNMGILR